MNRFLIFLFLLSIVLFVVWDSRKYLIKVNSSPINTSISSSIPMSQNNGNNWRTYSGSTLSFQYPNGWDDPIETLTADRHQIEIGSNLVVEDAIYRGEHIETSQPYAQYIKDLLIPLDINTEPYKLETFTGIRYFTEDSGWPTIIKIVLQDPINQNRIVTITCFSSADQETAMSIFDPVLESFSFK